MFLTVKDVKGNPDKTIKNRIKQLAIYNLYTFKLKKDDLKLNEYLKQTYNKNIIQLCKYLINNSIVQANNNQEYIIRFTTLSDNLLAQLITYGKGNLRGSNILKYAFERKGVL